MGGREEDDGGKTGGEFMEQNREYIVENHCQLAQNKSNTSLVLDGNGFVRVFYASEKPTTKFITRTYFVTMLTFMCNF